MTEKHWSNRTTLKKMVLHHVRIHFNACFELYMKCFSSKSDKKFLLGTGGEKDNERNGSDEDDEEGVYTAEV